MPRVSCEGGTVSVRVASWRSLTNLLPPLVSSHSSTELMRNQATGKGWCGQVSWPPLTLPLSEVTISCYILSCEIFFGPPPKKHLSLFPGCNTAVLRGFRGTVAKLSTWRSLFVPRSPHRTLGVLEEMASLSLNWASKGCHRFVAQNHPFLTYLTYLPAISDSGHTIMIAVGQ